MKFFETVSLDDVVPVSVTKVGFNERIVPVMGLSPRNQSAADDRQPASDLLSEISEDKGLTQRPPFGRIAGRARLSLSLSLSLYMTEL